MSAPHPSQHDVARRVAEARETAPESVEAILSLLPDLAAEVVRQDVASRRYGGVRSAEHDRLVGLTQALRDHLRAAEASAVHALMAIGCEAASARSWLRTGDAAEPDYQRPDEGLYRITIFRTAEDWAAFEATRTGGPPRPSGTAGGADGALDGKHPPAPEGPHHA